MLAYESAGCDFDHVRCKYFEVIRLCETNHVYIALLPTPYDPRLCSISPAVSLGQIWIHRLQQEPRIPHSSPNHALPPPRSSTLTPLGHHSMAPYQSRRASLNKRTSPPSEAARWISRPEIYATHRYLFLIAKKQVKQRLQDPELIRVVALLLADIRTFRSFCRLTAFGCWWQGF